MTDGVQLTLWLAFSAGLVSFVSPCVLPLIPSFVTYITGLSFAQLQQAHPGWRLRWTVFSHCLLFVVGFSTVFISLGALAGMVTVLREGLVWVQRLGGILVFLFGVHLTGLIHFGFLLGDKRIRLHHKPAGYLGTFLVGLAFAAGWTPCIGPILAAILTFAATSADSTGRAVLLLAAYSAGLGLPFLLSGLLFHGFLGFFKRFRSYIRLVEMVTGLLLMGVGMLLFFDRYNQLTGFLYRILPWS